MAAARYRSTGRFAHAVLGVDPRAVRRWRTGEREMQGTARIVCQAIVERPSVARELAAARWKLLGLPAPRNIRDDNGNWYTVAARPELAEIGARVPWCVLVDGGWYQVDEFRELEPDVPDEAQRFIDRMNADWFGDGKVERGPTWLATREEPLLLLVDNEVVRAYTTKGVTAEGAHWVFENNGEAGLAGAADPSDTLESITDRAKRYLERALPALPPNEWMKRPIVEEIGNLVYRAEVRPQTQMVAGGEFAEHPFVYEWWFVKKLVAERWKVVMPDDTEEEVRAELRQWATRKPGKKTSA